MTEAAGASQLVFLDTHYRTHHEKPYIQADYELLPIESDSIDTVLIMHALEVSSHPKAILEEVHRILKPGGNMIICCFNRWSLWNVMHYFGRKKVFPKAGRCYSLSAIKKQVRALDGEITVQQTVCFRPPFRKHVAIKQWLFLETLGQMIVPYCGAVVMVMATKKVVDMRPLIDLEWIKEMAAPQGVRA
jgi:SAM-dependent methyltransferase